ncbi:MAG: 1-acyl-sn-glycerol-3-phosphate acyltransferase [Candidatus Obscuribacterales bacterium]|nr:1-acyl-sn-glycerol-3-phosphate acyltransferase [Candidatus Obscuribacterales bacterium]
MYWVVLLVISGLALWRGAFWLGQGRKMQVSGYLPPEPSWFARLALGFASYLFTFLGVGPVKVIGAKNARYKGRLLIAPNHTFQLDFAMVRRAVGRSFRFMTHVNELKGLRGAFGAWSGAYPVETDSKNGGEAAAKATASALGAHANSAVLLFPQGKLVKDNVLRKEDFRYGAARISRQVQAEQPNEPVAILPVAIHYKRQPRWMPFFLKPLRRLFGVMNYGGVVVVGRPIPVNSLPEDSEAATDVIRQEIQQLLHEAMKN